MQFWESRRATRSILSPSRDEKSGHEAPLSGRAKGEDKEESGKSLLDRVSLPSPMHCSEISFGLAGRVSRYHGVARDNVMRLRSWLPHSISPR